MSFIKTVDIFPKEDNYLSLCLEDSDTLECISKDTRGRQHAEEEERSEEVQGRAWDWSVAENYKLEWYKQ